MRITLLIFLLSIFIVGCVPTSVLTHDSWDGEVDIYLKDSSSVTYKNNAILHLKGFKRIEGTNLFLGEFYSPYKSIDTLIFKKKDMVDAIKYDVDETAMYISSGIIVLFTLGLILK